MAYNYLTQYDASPDNYTPGREGHNISGITIHHWDDPSAGATFEGVISRFENPASQVSAHFVATGNGRRVACLVDLSDTAWQAGNWEANLDTIGIECDPSWNDETYDVVAELIADIRQAIGDVPLYPHSHWTATACPGAVDLGRLDTLARTKTPHGNWGDVSGPAPTTTTTTAAPTTTTTTTVAPTTTTTTVGTTTTTTLFPGDPFTTTTTVPVVTTTTTKAPAKPGNTTVAQDIQKLVTWLVGLLAKLFKKDK